MNNKIVNYFIDGSNGSILQSPVTVNAETAKKIILKTSKVSKGRDNRPLFHLCFDVESGIMYTPNKSEFTIDKYNELVETAKEKIVEDFGSYCQRPPIEGSPFSSLRWRRIGCFHNATDEIKKIDSEFDDLVVLEANLNRMPTTLNSLPEIFDTDHKGGYVSEDDAESITFIDEIDSSGSKRLDSITLLTHKPPFILINTGNDVSATDKEWAIITGYRQHLEKKRKVGNDIIDFADLYSVRRSLYLGWTFEEICETLCSDVSDFGEIINASKLLIHVADSIGEEGYSHPIDYPYYTIFQINPSTFPLRLNQLLDFENKSVNKDVYEAQKDNREFSIQGFVFEPNNLMQRNTIIIRSSVYIPEEICYNVLRANSKPIICKYDRFVDKILIRNRVDQNYLLRFRKVIDSVVALYDRDYGIGEKEIDLPNEHFMKRSISEYRYATNFINNMCCDNEIEFRDFDVVVGPIEMLFGSGTKGGFMGEHQFKESGLKTPFQVTEGIDVSPPTIFLDSVSMPSYDAQTETLIHEYRHYIFGEKNPDYKKQYSGFENKSGDEYYREWCRYFNDENEVAAHKEQIRYLLSIGESTDEIIRDKVGGQITDQNYLIALKFKEMVDSVDNETGGIK